MKHSTLILANSVVIALVLVASSPYFFYTHCRESRFDIFERDGIIWRNQTYETYWRAPLVSGPVQEITSVISKYNHQETPNSKAGEWFKCSIGPVSVRPLVSLGMYDNKRMGAGVFAIMGIALSINYWRADRDQFDNLAGPAHFMRMIMACCLCVSVFIFADFTRHACAEISRDAFIRDGAVWMKMKYSMTTSVTGYITDETVISMDFPRGKELSGKFSCMRLHEPPYLVEFDENQNSGEKAVHIALWLVQLTLAFFGFFSAPDKWVPKVERSKSESETDAASNQVLPPPPTTPIPKKEPVKQEEEDKMPPLEEDEKV
jgi:hypothetical protein